MRVLTVFTGTYPSGMAMTYRLHCYAKGLIENSSQFYVVTPQPKKNNDGKFFLYKNISNGVGYTILLNRSSFRVKFIKYLLKEINPFLLVFYCIVNIRKYDIFWLIKLGVIANIFIIPILHLFGKKVIFEVNENPYSGEGSRLTRIGWVNKLLRKLTFSWIYPQVDGFIIISENLRKLISPFKKENAQFLKIPILIDMYRNTNLDSNNTLPTKNPYIFHAGSLSDKKDGIINVFRAYAKACKRLGPNYRLDFVLTNNVTLPDTWKQLLKIIKKNKLEDRIIITGYLNYYELQNIIKNATLTIINKPYNNQNKYNFPTKIGDYMRNGLPIIVGARDVEMLYYLKNYENSIISKPDNVDELCNSIIVLISDKVLHNKLSINSIDTAHKFFSYKLHGLRLKEFFSYL